MNGPKYELENVVIFKGQIYLNSGADEKVSRNCACLQLLYCLMCLCCTYVSRYLLRDRCPMAVYLPIK